MLSNFELKKIYDSFLKYVSTVLLSSSGLISTKYKVELKCITKCSWDKTNTDTKQCMKLQDKFKINIIKLTIKCRLLPLNVNSFFDFNLES